MRKASPSPPSSLTQHSNTNRHPHAPTGTPKLATTGLELVRRDNAQLLPKIQKKFLELLIVKGDARAALLSVHAQIRALMLVCSNINRQLADSTRLPRPICAPPPRRRPPARPSSERTPLFATARKVAILAPPCVQAHTRCAARV